MIFLLMTIKKYCNQCDFYPTSKTGFDFNYRVNPANFKCKWLHTWMDINSIACSFFKPKGAKLLQPSTTMPSKIPRQLTTAELMVKHAKLAASPGNFASKVRFRTK